MATRPGTGPPARGHILPEFTVDWVAYNLNQKGGPGGARGAHSGSQQALPGRLWSVGIAGPAEGWA